ncbi:hypothetical protein ABKA04_009966 [Annulohypoxylon sp. FPYF3050]
MAASTRRPPVSILGIVETDHMGDLHFSDAMDLSSAMQSDGGSASYLAGLDPPPWRSSVLVMRPQARPHSVDLGIRPSLGVFGSPGDQLRVSLQKPLCDRKESISGSSIGMAPSLPRPGGRQRDQLGYNHMRGQACRDHICLPDSVDHG